MLVSFIIPLYNCLPLTRAMLDSLRATLPTGIENEIILVDDGSTDGTREWLQSLTKPYRVFLNEKNSGFAPTCNHGAKNATGELIFFLNNDLVLLPHWFEPILAAFKRFKDAGLVGNVQLATTTDTVDHAGIRFSHKGKPEHITTIPWFARITGYREVPALTGACFAMRRATWQLLGGFDEGFVNGAEDVDLCLRASLIGLRHYMASRSIVRHHVSASTGRKLRDEQNTYRLVRRWNDSIARLSAHEWCRHFISTHWDQSFVYDYALGREALYYWLQLLPAPPARVLAGTRAAIDVELDRWQKLFPTAS